MSLVTKPILLDETGKDILGALHTQNELLRVIARDTIGSFNDDWKSIQSIVRQGLAPKVFNIGDQFIVPWTDVATDTTYEVPLDIVHFGKVTLRNGSVVDGMYLQWHYTTPSNVQFDAAERQVAEGLFSSDLYYYVPDGYDTVGKQNFRLLTPQEEYTVGTPVPATNAPYVSSIRDESGTIIKQGYDRWSHSGYRQFLNSRKGVGAWWTAQHVGDTAPDELSRRAGFMSGFDEDFLSAIQPVKVTTALNKMSDAHLGQSEDTYDTFFLPSLEQVYARPKVAGVEGEAFDYWKSVIGTQTPSYPYYVADPLRVTYGINSKMSPKSMWLRSSNTDGSSVVFMIGSNGEVSNIRAESTFVCTPVCVVC